MAKLMYNALLFYIALNISAFLFSTFGMHPTTPSNLPSVYATFSITQFVNTFTVVGAIGGAAIIGLVSLLTRIGTYAIFALILWAIALFVTLVAPFVLALPNFFYSLGLPTSVMQPVVYGIIAPVVAFALFWFLWQAVAGRYD